MEHPFSIEKNDALNYLKDHPLGTLATLNGDTVPELSAVYFAVDRDYSCYFITKQDTRKFQNISARPTATLLCVSEEALTSVELTGQVELVTDTLRVVRDIERFQDIAASRKSGYWIPPISQISAGYYVVCRLIPHTMRVNVFSQEAGGTPRQSVFDLRG